MSIARSRDFGQLRCAELAGTVTSCPELQILLADVEIPRAGVFAMSHLSTMLQFPSPTPFASRSTTFPTASTAVPKRQFVQARL